MKNHVSITPFIISICTIAGGLHAAVSGERQAMAKCTKQPCPNTQSGEDPGIIEAREGEKIEAELRADPNDKERWSNIILFSSSTEKRQLSIPIVMTATFDMTLDPKKGLLTFCSPNASQSFKISEASSESNSNNPCPKYQIRVVKGGAGYVLIKKLAQNTNSARKGFTGALTTTFTIKKRIRCEASGLPLLRSTPQPRSRPPIQSYLLKSSRKATNLTELGFFQATIRRHQ
jgi:hypothetical protein